jgi:hypothetical protein
VSRELNDVKRFNQGLQDWQAKNLVKKKDDASVVVYK